MIRAGTHLEELVRKVARVTDVLLDKRLLRLHDERVEALADLLEARHEVLLQAHGVGHGRPKAVGGLARLQVIHKRLHGLSDVREGGEGRVDARGPGWAKGPIR